MTRLTDLNEAFTVFAPKNDLFKKPELVATHVVNETVRNIDLRSYSVLQPLKENALLHVTEVPYRQNGKLFEVSIISVCMCIFIYFSCYVAENIHQWH